MSNSFNCVAKFKCEKKTKRLSTDRDYQRPTKTLTDELQTNDKMREKLTNYIRVDDIDLIPLNTHLRYVTWQETASGGQQKFRLGGFLKKKDYRYVVLSNGSISWSVQRYHWKKGANIETDKPEWDTIFFRLLSTDEQQAAIIDKQRQEIDELKSLISRK